MVGLEATAFAQSAGDPQGPGAQPLPSNVQVSPQGDVTVTRTPAQGVEVHAQTPAGTVHAYGCSRVYLDRSTAGQAPPCAAAAPPAPPVYPYPYPPPVYYAPPPPPPAHLAPPAYYEPMGARGVDVRPRKPAHPPDPARKAALIASSLVFGIGTVAAGTSYLVSLDPATAHGKPSRPALVAMGAFMTVTPSVPRFVVGSVGSGLLFTGLRGASFMAGTLIDWDDKSYVLPVTLAFVAPVTLGIVDLATTPRRKLNAAPKDDDDVAEHKETALFQLEGIAPTVSADHTGALIPAVSAVGTF